MFCALLLSLATAVAAADAPEVLLWPNGAPGSEGRSTPEVVVDRGANGVLNRTVANVHKPSLTVYLPPKEKATGAAMIICPGGGHRYHSIDLEGHEVARWLNTIGAAAFILKYRLAREKGSPYQVEVHALQDGLRSVRLVRSRAKEWGLDPARVGMLGFSAGGEIAALVATRWDKGTPPGRTR